MSTSGWPAIVILRALESVNPAERRPSDYGTQLIGVAAMLSRHTASFNPLMS
jgi:hypothetical protein